MRPNLSKINFLEEAHPCLVIICGSHVMFPTFLVHIWRHLKWAWTDTMDAIVVERNQLLVFWVGPAPLWPLYFFLLHFYINIWISSNSCLSTAFCLLSIISLYLRKLVLRMSWHFFQGGPNPLFCTLKSLSLSLVITTHWCYWSSWCGKDDGNILHGTF